MQYQSQLEEVWGTSSSTVDTQPEDVSQPNLMILSSGEPTAGYLRVKWRWHGPYL